MNTDEQDIREVHSTWIDAVNAGDLDRLLSMMTDDVVLINPGEEPFGRDRFSANFSNTHQQLQIDCSSELAEVVVIGDVAHTWSRDALSLTSRADGETTKLAGHRLTIYRKQPDGRWLLARDAHTLSVVEK